MVLVASIAAHYYVGRSVDDKEQCNSHPTGQGGQIEPDAGTCQRTHLTIILTASFAITLTGVSLFCFGRVLAN